MARKKAATPLPVQIAALIIDKSGSMGSCQTAVIDGYREFTETLKSNTTHEVRATVTLFDTVVQRLFSNVDCAHIVPLSTENYVPGGCTALNDAVAQTIVAIDAELVNHPKDTPVIVCIMTDGAENSSREFPDVRPHNAGRAAVRKMIEERQNRGNWTFVFMGDQYQAKEQAEAFGIPDGNTKGLDYTVETQSSMEAMSASYACLSRSGASSTRQFFSNPDADQDPQPAVVSGTGTGKLTGS